MRPVVFWKDPQGEVFKVATTKRVHRVAGWKKNLQSRLEGFKLGPRCSCGCPMIERKGKNGNFYGCCSYPICKETKSA